MKPRYDFPSNVEDSSIKLVGRFTWKDIIRIGIPTIISGILAPPLHQNTLTFTLYLVFGLAVGVSLYKFRWHGEKLDSHLYNISRFYLKKLYQKLWEKYKEKK